jgi:hypothetical protein
LQSRSHDLEQNGPKLVTHIGTRQGIVAFRIELLKVYTTLEQNK